MYNQTEWLLIKLNENMYPKSGFLLDLRAVMNSIFMILC